MVVQELRPTGLATTMYDLIPTTWSVCSGLSLKHNRILSSISLMEIFSSSSTSLAAPESAHPSAFMLSSLPPLAFNRWWTNPSRLQIRHTGHCQPDRMASLASPSTSSICQHQQMQAKAISRDIIWQHEISLPGYMIDH